MTLSYAVTSFSGEYRFLSNFYPCVVEFEGMPFFSVEAAYQAAKNNDLLFRKELQLCTPSQAKRLGQHTRLRPDWDRIKLDVMKSLLARKFPIDQPEINLPLSEYLLLTNGMTLIEGNDWGDLFWGVEIQHGGEYRGQNHLGRLLMVRREELRAARTSGDLEGKVKDNSQSATDPDITVKVPSFDKVHRIP
jgi:ribA/ribD-fused uncharacterized protein